MTGKIMNKTDNVDPAELAKFDALASRWWDPEGEFRPLHQINPLRLDWIRQHVDLSSARALDIGCGGGILMRPAGKAGWRRCLFHDQPQPEILPVRYCRRRVHSQTAAEGHARV